MPAMVKLAASRSYQPTDETDAAAYKHAKSLGVKSYDYTTAMENIRNSKGMFSIVEDGPTATQAVRRLDDMTAGELKDAAIAQGIRLDKRISKTDLIRLLRDRADVVDDDEEDDIPGEQ